MEKHSYFSYSTRDMLDVWLFQGDYEGQKSEQNTVTVFPFFRPGPHTMIAWVGCRLTSEKTKS
jgi:hypothetical protein